MIRQGSRDASTVNETTIYRRAGAYAVAGGVLGLVWLPSAAEAARTPVDTRTRLVSDHNNDGNGHHNATSLSVRSPVRNRGYQHTTNRNAGGVSDAQNALCHNVRVCNVTQRVTMVVPEKTVAAGAPPSGAAEALPSGAVPQTRTSPLGSLVSMGPYGLIVMGGGSASPEVGSAQPGPLDCPPNFFW
ncbi:MAG: hypothetical protein ACJ72W_30265 [Actinoallomurus sp.]